jgi:hypothetical protein
MTPQRFIIWSFAMAAMIWDGRDGAAVGAALPQDLSAKLGAAAVAVHGDQLEVSTGRIRRVWRWTGNGLVTVRIEDCARQQNPLLSKPIYSCDWAFPGAVDDSSPAKLVSMTVAPDDDDGFTNQHLQVVATIRYEAAGLELQFIIWVYPDAPGIRTQLRAKSLDGFDPKPLQLEDRSIKSHGGTLLAPGARVDYLPLDLSVPNARRYWGYFNDPGNRHDQSRDMLEEKECRGFPVFQPETIDWASAEAVEYGEQGFIVVKESPKCVNQPAHLTGAFFTGPAGLAVTGPGLAPQEIEPDRFRDCWATWTIVYGGGNDGLQLALKQFEAARYPVFPDRDMFILGNTWGPSNPDGAQFTEESFVRKEIPLLADLGIDALQIDDGWQKHGRYQDAGEFLPRYPDGWKNIKADCDRYGLRLGLWVSVRNARVEDMTRNLDELGFITWKADFDHLASRTDYEVRFERLRDVMKHSWMKTQFALCPEYDEPRYGWYFAQEYGSIYFQNVQEGLPAHLTMVPYQVLRQHWLMSKYFPANKLQVMLQNPKRTRQDLSDAYQHGHGYCFAMGLPFVPVFFQSAQFLDDDGRKELAALIKIYKAHRKDIFTSYTFPIGDEPDNASWSGFQMVSTTRTGGYLLLFRELHNTSSKRAIVLKFLSGKRINLMDLQSGASRDAVVPADGAVEFELKEPASYCFYQYTVAEKQRATRVGTKPPAITLKPA